MERNKLIESARALVKHLEADRLADAQVLAGELDYEISQVAPPPPPSTPEERTWVKETLAAADREAARKA